MQDRDATRGRSYECAEDLAADGVVYAEVRLAPELSTEKGLTLDEVIDAVLDRLPPRLRRHRPHDLRDPVGDAHRRPRPRRSPSWPCVRRDGGVVGFDIAGAEAGYPPGAAPRRVPVRHTGRTSTPPSTPARRSVSRRSGRRVQFCGAERLGHGVRHRRRHRSRRRPVPTRPPGRRTSVTGASRLRCARTSNVNTGVVPDDRHPPDRDAAPPAVPSDRQHRQPPDERHLDDQGRSRAAPRRCSTGGSNDFEWLTVNAMKTAFAPFDERLRTHQRRDQTAEASTPCYKRAALGVACSMAFQPCPSEVRPFDAPPHADTLVRRPDMTPPTPCSART